MISTGFTSLDGSIGGLVDKKDYLIGLMSYAAYRFRERRAPRLPLNANVPEFFKRYELPR